MKKILFILLSIIFINIFSFSQIEYTDENFNFFKKAYKVIPIPNKNPAKYISMDSIITSKEFYKLAPKDSLKNADDEYKELQSDFFKNKKTDIDLSYVRKIPKKIPFNVGEKLTFSVSYGIINAATGILEVKELVNIRGEKCLHFVSKGMTNSFFSIFYKVVDIIDSYMSIEKFHSLKLSKNMREGNYRKNRICDFYPEKLLAVYNNGKKYIIPPYNLDVFSAFYYVRTLDLIPGDEIIIDSHDNGKNYPIEVIVHSYETVKVNGQKYNTIKIEPKLRGEGIFRQKGRIFIWLTNDEKKMPVLLKASVVVDIGKGLELGNITAELVEYNLGNN